MIPYWHTEIVPVVKAGQKVVIAAHGNSLRALVKYLDGMSEEAIIKLNIPTGVPLVYELDGACRLALSRRPRRDRQPRCTFFRQGEVKFYQEITIVILPSVSFTITRQKILRKLWRSASSQGEFICRR